MVLVSWNQSSFTKLGVRVRHSRRSGIQKPLIGFRVALAIASLPGMTLNYVTNFRDATLVIRFL